MWLWHKWYGWKRNDLNVWVMYICMFVIIMNNIDINSVVNILLVIHISVYSYERPVARFPWLRIGLLKTSRIIADIYVHLCKFQQYKIMNHSSFGVTHVVLFHFSIGPMRHLSKTVATNNCIVCHTMTTTIDWSPIIHSHPLVLIGVWSEHGRVPSVTVQQHGLNPKTGVADVLHFALHSYPTYSPTITTQISCYIFMHTHRQLHPDDKFTTTVYIVWV